MTDLYTKVVLTLIAISTTGLCIQSMLPAHQCIAPAPVASVPAPAATIGQTGDGGYSHAARQGLDDAVEKSR